MLPLGCGSNRLIDTAKGLKLDDDDDDEEEEEEEEEEEGKENDD